MRTLTLKALLGIALLSTSSVQAEGIECSLKLKDHVVNQLAGPKSVYAFQLAGSSLNDEIKSWADFYDRAGTAKNSTGCKVSCSLPSEADALSMSGKPGLVVGGALISADYPSKGSAPQAASISSVVSQFSKLQNYCKEFDCSYSKTGKGLTITLNGITQTYETKSAIGKIDGCSPAMDHGPEASSGASKVHKSDPIAPPAEGLTDNNSRHAR